MKPVLSRAQVRAFDAKAIGDHKVPGLVLMENAGRGATEIVARRAGDVRGARIVIACGTGNNGGDGFVIARHLASRGADVRVFVIGAAARIGGDARANYDAWLGVGGTADEIGDVSRFASALEGAACVVDALYGTGLDRPITGAAAAVIDAMNAAKCARVAVDIPSGLDADTGVPLGSCVIADATATFGHHKPGLLTPRGARFAGEVHLVDLGVPQSLGGFTPSAELLERHDVASLFPARRADVHKHGAGHVAVFGGSHGKVGAPLMAARAALRAGAGLATIASWAESSAGLEARVLEEMTATLARDAIDASVTAALKGKRAIVVGPGFGLDDDARQAVRALLAAWKGPALYDADALTLFAGTPETFAGAAVSAVLTPHAGECARLLGTTSEAVEADRFGSARALAAKAHAVVLLKGAYTLVANHDGRVVVSPSGTPALATAGSGDTLAGILGAFLCALDPFEATYAATYVHGLAAERWSAAHGDRGLLASEIADLVPDVLASLRG